MRDINRRRAVLADDEEGRKKRRSDIVSFIKTELIDDSWSEKEDEHKMVVEQGDVNQRIEKAIITKADKETKEGWRRKK